MKAITADGLSKIYAGETAAVDGIRFSLDKGEIFGFLGPNGAGKTTTVKLLCGMLAPSGGKCEVLGIDPAKNPEQLHKIAGVVTEHAQMYDHMTALENLQFYGTLFGMSRSECTERAQEICTTYGLMNRGRLFAAGNITELRAMACRNTKLRIKASCMPKDMAYREAGDHFYEVDVASEHDIPLIVKRIVDAGGDLYHVSEERLSLEEIYFSLIDREHTETERESL